MKKILFFITALTIVSCGTTDDKCQYTKMSTVTYNFTYDTSKVIDTDNAEGCYVVSKTANEAHINNSKKVFSIDIKTTPNELTINDDGSTHIYKEVDGFKLGNSISGDTLIIKYIPTENTPSAILPFGIAYKFYN